VLSTLSIDKISISYAFALKKPNHECAPYCYTKRSSVKKMTLYLFIHKHNIRKKLCAQE